MINTGYLYSNNNKRLFINTALGCSSSCSFCYLDRLGYKKGLKKLEYKNSDKILREIDKANIDINKDTLISFGCFSECFSDNKEEVVKLIKHFLILGNMVQVSTKKKIDPEIFNELLPFIKYYGQLVIFTSSSTISEHDIYETRTDSIEMRFQNFLHINEIPVVLYIKPVIQGVTINDIDDYIEYIQTYGIKDVVVGSMFTSSGKGVHVPFSDDANLYYDYTSDEGILICELSKYARVETRSSKILEYYKR